MAKLIDPDSLTQGTEIVITPATKTIQLLVAGNLSTDGVTGKCLYSFLKEEWLSDTDLPPFPFPMVAVTDEQFELVNGWNFADATTKNLIRDAGWALKDTSGVSQEEYMNVTSLGAFDAGTDQAYYQQATGANPTDVVLAGEVNQAVKIYGDASHDDFDYRDYFKLFLREQGKTYASYDLLTEQSLSALTYKKYALPLSNGSDLKITASDASIAADAPYTGMSITWYAVAQSIDIGGTNYDFSVIVDGNGGTKEEIYEFVQYQLRQTSDIDAGAGTVRGDVADALMHFVGDTLYTSTGVYISDFDASDTNSIVFTDDTGTERTFPYTASLTLQFGENLVADASAKYWVFFTNDDAGDNAGYDYGTADAIIVNDASDTPMTDSVSGGSSVTLTFDYDGNVQRGAASAGEDAPITVVAIGFDTAQFVRATGTITRSTSNQVSLVAALERNASNPA